MRFPLAAITLLLWALPVSANLLANPDFQREAVPSWIEGFWITDERTYRQWGATAEAALTNELSFETTANYSNRTQSQKPVLPKPPLRPEYGATQDSAHLVEHLRARRTQINTDLPQGTWGRRSPSLRGKDGAVASHGINSPNSSRTTVRLDNVPRPSETVVVPPSSWRKVLQERRAKAAAADTSPRATHKPQGSSRGSPESWVMRITDTIANTDASSTGHQAIVQYIEANPGAAYTLSADILWRSGDNQTLFLEILDRENVRVAHATASPTKKGGWSRITTPPLTASDGAAFVKAVLYSCKPCTGTSYWDNLDLEGPASRTRRPPESRDQAKKTDDQPTSLYSIPPTTPKDTPGKRRHPY